MLEGESKTQGARILPFRTQIIPTDTDRVERTECQAQVTQNIRNFRILIYPDAVAYHIKRHIRTER